MSAYYQIQLEEFEAAMRDQPVQFERRSPDWTKEYIYECDFTDLDRNEHYVLRVYSSVDERSDEARDCGSDAIRCVLLYAEPERDEQYWEPVFSESRTHRTPGWDDRLTEKLYSIMNRLGDQKRCPECNRVMVLRENSDEGSKFWGCTGYHPRDADCYYTEDYDG